MDANVSFYSLLIIAALAFVLPLVVNKIKKVKIPVVIAEIIAGIIVGKSGLNIIRNDIWIEFLSLFGFAYLMFLSGVEIDFAYFKKIRRFSGKNGNPLVIGIALFLLTVALSYLPSLALTHYGMGKDPLFMTIIFSTTSLGIVVPILKEKKIINEPIGQTILVSALIADFASMLLIPVVMFLRRSEGSLQLLASLLIFVIFALLYVVSKRFFKLNFNNDTFESSQMKIRAAFALILIFVSLAEFADVEIILGAFLAGMLFSLLFSEFRSEVTPKLDAIGYGFLIPIFFITIGANMDLRTVLTVDTLLALPIYIGIAYLVKLLPSLILRRSYPWRETLGAGFLLSSRLSLVIAISLVALEAGIIEETTYSTFILVAIVTCIASPILFARIFPKQEEKKETLLIMGNVEFLSSIAGKAELGARNLILCDTGPKTRAIFDKRRVAYTYWEDAGMVTAESIRNESVRTFVAVYEDDARNVELCALAHGTGVKNIIALIHDPKISYELERNGIRSVTPVRAMHTLLLSYILYPESFDVLFSVGENDDIDVREIELDEHSIVGLKLRDLHLPGDCLVLMVSRDGKRIVPDGNTRLEKGDVLVIIGSKEYTAELNSVIV